MEPTRAPGGGLGSADAPVALDDSDEDNEYDCEAIMTALLAKRGELEAGGAHRRDNFNVVLRGGLWTASKTGKVFDSVRAQAR